MLEKIGALLQGKKAYAIALLAGVGTVLTVLGIDIPTWIWPLLGAAGLGAVRSAIGKSGPTA